VSPSKAQLPDAIADRRTNSGQDDLKGQQAVADMGKKPQKLTSPKTYQACRANLSRRSLQSEDGSLIDGGKAWIFLSPLSACVFGESTERNKKETLCELCDSSAAGGE
jgi:hypothetical protein